MKETYKFEEYPFNGNICTCELVSDHLGDGYFKFKITDMTQPSDKLAVGMVLPMVKDTMMFSNEYFEPFLERIEDLRMLKDDWLDSVGKPIDHTYLNLFASEFTKNYSQELPLPAIFPTLEGGIILEWANTKLNTSVTISFNFDGFNCEIFILFNKECLTYNLVFLKKSTWNFINDKINEYIYWDFINNK